MTLTRNQAGFLRSGTMLLAGAAALICGGLQSPGVAEAANPSQCLWINRIDHTQVLNDHQILFYEVNGKVWLSELPTPCRTLGREYGIALNAVTIPKLCGNLEQFRVLQTGESCLLGPFVAYTPEHK